MSPLRVLIADDEAPARRKLIRMLTASGMEIIAEAADGAAAHAAIAALRPDVVFADIDMPGLNGLELAETIAAPTQFVFVTAHAAFALQAFELHACDYLLKPYDQARLNDVVAQIRERQGAVPRRLALDDGARILMLEESAIDWIGAAGNYVEVHGGGKTVLARTTMEAMAAQLPDFLRINRSALVRRGAIAELRKRPHGEFLVTLGDGTALMWTRRFRGPLVP